MEITEVENEPERPIGSNIYVAVGEGKSSEDALRWALRNEVQPSSTVFLVHVFPEVKKVPTPLGMMPRSNANPQQLQVHMAYVRSKRRELLTTFINLCHSSKVNVDTILIESDQIDKAIIELIPVLNIQTLVVGVSKSNLKKLKKEGAVKANKISKAAPKSCQVKIICCGKVFDPAGSISPSSPTTSGSASPYNPEEKPIEAVENGRPEKNKIIDSVLCKCFSGKF